MFIILVIIIVILLLYMHNEQHDDSFKKNTIKTLVRQASRWSIASKQDQSPLISVLHANYGAGYLWALFDIATADEIHRYANIDVLKFRNDITKIQDSATQNLTKVCPHFFEDNDYLAHVAGDVF